MSTGHKFQVVIYNKSKYILGYRVYQWEELKLLLDYIQFVATRADVNSIEVTRWTLNGERA